MEDEKVLYEKYVKLVKEGGVLFVDYGIGEGFYRDYDGMWEDVWKEFGGVEGKCLVVRSLCEEVIVCGEVVDVEW